MTQNRSHAVMAQRAEAHDSLDHFPTPPWATRALCEWIIAGVIPAPALQGMSAWEPACAEGHMARPLAEYFGAVHASDVHAYGFGKVRDFLFDYRPNSDGEFDWIITNPPFRLGQKFAETAIRRARYGVALLVRTAFLESSERHASLFSPHPPSDILQFVERVPMFKGRLDAKGSTATAYCWLIWRAGQETYRFETRFYWLAPCRKRLERAGDYPAGAPAP